MNERPGRSIQPEIGPEMVGYKLTLESRLDRPCYISQSNLHIILYFDFSVCSVAVLGQDKGYTVKYSPLPRGVPEGTPKSEGLYLTVYPESSS